MLAETTGVSSGLYYEKVLMTALWLTKQAGVNFSKILHGFGLLHAYSSPGVERLKGAANHDACFLLPASCFLLPASSRRLPTSCTGKPVSKNTKLALDFICRNPRSVNIFSTISRDSRFFGNTFIRHIFNLAECCQQFSGQANVFVGIGHSGINCLERNP